MPTIKLNLSKKRERLYLDALRTRYNQPTWNWTRLIGMAVRELYAMQCQDEVNQAIIRYKGDPKDE